MSKEIFMIIIVKLFKHQQLIMSIAYLSDALQFYYQKFALYVEYKLY